MSAQGSELAELLALIQSQQRTIDRLSAQIESGSVKLATAPSAPAPNGRARERSRPIDWWSLSGAERQETWWRLSDFVESLVERYSLQLVILPCWWRHRDAVEELTALWEVRKNCFGENAGPKDGMSWRDTFHKSCDRLRGLFGSCRESHLDQDVGMWMMPEGRAEFRRAVLQDGADHSDAVMRSQNERNGDLP